MPAARFQIFDPPLLEIRREHRAKPNPPLSDGFVANVDAPLVEQIFDVAKRQWKSKIHHDRKADDFEAGLEVSKRRALGHAVNLSIHPAPLILISSDSVGIGAFAISMVCPHCAHVR